MSALIGTDPGPLLAVLHDVHMSTCFVLFFQSIVTPSSHFHHALGTAFL
jgi:hypothetical protein